MGGRDRPTADPQISKFNSGSRHIPAVKHVKEATRYRHAWWLKFGRVDRREGTILSVSAEISQITDAPGLDCVVNLFLFLVE